MRQARKVLIRGFDDTTKFRNIYVAGLFDSTGKVIVTCRVDRNNSVYHCLKMTITCGSRAQLQWLMGQFDRGYISQNRWILTGPQARDVLTVIVDDCIIKRRLAIVGIAYQNSVDANRDFMRQTNDRAFSKNLSVEELERREEFRERLNALAAEED